MTKLHGQVAVITGATAGMALAAAKLFVTEGAHVYITGRRKDQLDDAVSEIGGSVTGVRSDSGNPRDLDLLVDAVRAGHGRVDVLYVSAGIGTVEEPLTAVTEDSFDTVFGVNVRGALFTVQKLLPLMSNGGSIILNGSTVWGKGIPGQRRLRRHQSSPTLLRAHLGRRTGRARYPRQRPEPRADRHRHDSRHTTRIPRTDRRPDPLEAAGPARRHRQGCTVFGQ